MTNSTPKPTMGTASSNPFATALVWSTPWLVILTIYFVLYTWKPELGMFDTAKPLFTTLLGIALFAVSFLSVYTLSRKSTKPTGGMPGMPPQA